jgi:hypothetical protein
MSEQNATAIELLQELLTEIKALRAAILELASAPAPQVQPAAATPAGELVTFEMTEIVYSIDDNGKNCYKARGPLFPQFGIRVWDEVLPKLGIDPKTLEPGPNPFAAQVIAIKGEMYPKKVIGLVNGSQEAPPAAQPTQDGQEDPSEPEYVRNEDEVPF